MSNPRPKATGTVLWLDDAPNGNARLEITTGTVSHIYEVARHPEGGFMLLRANKGDVVCYRVRAINRNVWMCDCPDATNRPERRCNCKHARGLAVALRSLPF